MVGSGYIDCFTNKYNTQSMHKRQTVECHSHSCLAFARCSQFIAWSSSPRPWPGRKCCFVSKKRGHLHLGKDECRIRTVVCVLSKTKAKFQHILRDSGFAIARLDATRLVSAKKPPWRPLCLTNEKIGSNTLCKPNISISLAILHVFLKRCFMRCGDGALFSKTYDSGNLPWCTVVRLRQDRAGSIEDNHWRLGWHTGDRSELPGRLP